MTEEVVNEAAAVAAVQTPTIDDIDSAVASLFETDAEKEKGLWLDWGDVSVCITRAGANNKRFVATMESAMKPHRKMFQLGAMAEIQQVRILRYVYAKTIVTAWRIKGVDVPYDPVRCEKLFEKTPEFFQWIVEEATKLGNFKTVAEDADAKNS